MYGRMKCKTKYLFEIKMLVVIVSYFWLDQLICIAREKCKIKRAIRQEGGGRNDENALGISGEHGGISLDYGVKRVIWQRESRIIKVSNNHHVSRTTKYRVPKPSIWDLGLWLVKIDHLVLGRFLVG